jgi:FK506-binding protein 2
MRSCSLLSFLSFSLFSAVSVAAEGLQIEKTHTVETCKRRTVNGDVIEMHYRGTLASDGSQFDSSYDRDSTLVFELGAGRVIKGYVAFFFFLSPAASGFFNDSHMLM